MILSGNKKRFAARWPVLVVFALLFYSETVFSQCDPDQNAYMFLHPAFAGKNWAQTAYDSILIMPSDVMCGLKPALFDICGVKDSAVGVFIANDRNLYMVRTSYSCSGGCMPCMLEYLDPNQITLAGIAVSPVSPLYLPKDNSRYGNNVVKVLFATAQNQVLALSINVFNQSIAKRDTLKLSALSAGQTVLRIQGDYDTATKKDIGVWVLGSQGLIRHFTLANDGWGNETKADIATTDTVFCAQNGYAGTSSGTMYRKNTGISFVLDSKPVSSAITNIYAKGAVGKKGTILEFSSGSWIDRHAGASDYWYGNFSNRWDGAGVEVLDSGWLKTGYTYHDFPSLISSTQPFTYTSNMIYSYTTTTNVTVTVAMNDPDNSFTDFGLSLFTGGSTVSLKNDGKFTILNIPGSTLCPMDSIRLKNGTITLSLAPGSVQVSAQCMRGQYIPLCQSYSWVDYSFAVSHSWNLRDTVTVSTLTNRLRIVNNYSSTMLAYETPIARVDGISSRVSGRLLQFSVPRDMARKLNRIVLYNVKGQAVAVIPVEDRSLVTVPLDDRSSGIVYAKYFFANGVSSGRTIVLIR